MSKAGKSTRRRRGRPPLPAGEAKRASFNTRLRQDTKQRLEKEASLAGRSLSEEIESRLEQSLHEGDAQSEVFGGDIPLKIMMGLAIFATATSELRGKDWLRDPTVFDEVISQWYVVLVKLRPGAICDSEPWLQWNLPDYVANSPQRASDVLYYLANKVKGKSIRAAIAEAIEHSSSRKVIRTQGNGMSLRFSRLDRSAIRRLHAGQKITEHGITAERVADGDTRYSVNVMVDGQRIHRVIGRESEGVTRTQAEEFIQRARSEAREGRLSLPSRRKTYPTFTEAADKYLKSLEGTDGKNLVAKRRQLRLYLKPFFASQRLDAISTFTVDRYKRHRIDAGASKGTVNLELATLSHLLNKAVEWQWLKARPCKVKLLEKSVGRIVALTEDQERALLGAAATDADPYCWLFVVFGLNTAMRHSEILRARFDQINFEHNRLFIPKAKAGDREQPITPELGDILKREQQMAKDPAGWVFPSPRPGASLTGHRDRLDKPFRRAVVAAGLDPKLVTPHVMRHTAITNLVKAGVDLPTIQRISGHKTLAMVMRYTHVHGDHIDWAIRAIGRGISEPTANKTADTTTQGLHRHAAMRPTVALAVVKKT